MRVTVAQQQHAGNTADQQQFWDSVQPKMQAQEVAAFGSACTVRGAGVRAAVSTATQVRLE